MTSSAKVLKFVFLASKPAGIAFLAYLFLQIRIAGNDVIQAFPVAEFRIRSACCKLFIAGVAKMHRFGQWPHFCPRFWRWAAYPIYYVRCPLCYLCGVGCHLVASNFICSIVVAILNKLRHRGPCATHLTITDHWYVKASFVHAVFEEQHGLLHCTVTS
jgi:hypothetical protein